MSLFRSVDDVSSSCSSEASDSESDHAELADSFHEAEENLASSWKGKGKEKGKSEDETAKSAQDDDDTQYSLPDTTDRFASQHGHRDMKDMVDFETHSTVTSALLEFYCLTRAADILNSQKDKQGHFTRDSPEVQLLGRDLYAYKSGFLSKHGLLASGVEKEELRDTRQYYRDRLDLLGLAALNGRDLGGFQDQRLLSLAAEDFGEIDGRRLLTAKAHADPTPFKSVNRSLKSPLFEDLELDAEDTPDLVLSRFPSSPTSYPLCAPRAVHPANVKSRYAVEFNEIKFLGRGSFGEVHHVKNYVDGQEYAVKRIPISQRRLEKLFSGGQNQLENILREIRTLARLEHTNIVRYYGAWVEQTDMFRRDAHNKPTYSQRSQRLIDLESQESTDEQSFGIVFEDSGSGAHSHSAPIDPDGESFDETQYSGNHQSVGRSPHEEDEDSESKLHHSNSVSYSQPSSSGASDEDIFTDGLSRDGSKLEVQQRKPDHGIRAPAIILHIQMSLHPLSLNSYLNMHQRENNQIAFRRHCFHLTPSLRIMLDIINGVQYLHSKGIVHRDLKPANIFLSAPEEIDSRECAACKVKYDIEHRFYRPRIGDFGLVADIPHLNDNTESTTMHTSHVVGTEFYRPSISMGSARQACGEDAKSENWESLYSIDEKIDVYALGVIFFELLYRLDTKMERQLVLAQLTREDSNRSPFPEDFSSKVDMGERLLDGRITVAKSLMACIKGMLKSNSKERLSCQSVKEQLNELLVATGRMD